MITLKPDTYPSTKAELVRIEQDTPTAKDLEKIERCAYMCQRRREGYTITDIARELRISPHTVSRELREYWAALAEASHEDLAEIRALDLARLDDLYKSMSKLAATGDTAANAQCLRILERRAKYHGLDAPDKVELRALIPDAKLDMSKLTVEELEQYKALYSKVVVP